MPIFDALNLGVAILAFLIAVYGIYYTKKCNRRKLLSSDGQFIKESNKRFIARFALYNASPVPTTVLKISFFDDEYSPMVPILNYEPKQTYSDGGPYGMVPDIIPEDMYADTLDGPCVLFPYSSEEFGYYFDKYVDCMIIEVTCEERIYRLKRHQSFLVHFSYIED